MANKVPYGPQGRLPLLPFDKSTVPTLQFYPGNTYIAMIL